jgi:integrase
LPELCGVAQTNKSTNVRPTVSIRVSKIDEGKVLPRIRFHDLRYMHVSLLNKAGVDARTIADRIRHTDPAFTLKRYAHVFDDQRKAAAIPC